MQSLLGGTMGDDSRAREPPFIPVIERGNDVKTSEHLLASQ